MDENKVVTLPVIRIDRYTDNGNPNIQCDEASVSLPAGLADAIGDLGFEDMEAAFNMRDWLQKACEAAGAKMIGGGFGGGQADLDIELEGCKFFVSIKPWPS